MPGHGPPYTIYDCRSDPPPLSGQGEGRRPCGVGILLGHPPGMANLAFSAFRLIFLSKILLSYWAASGNMCLLVLVCMDVVSAGSL